MQSLKPAQLAFFSYAHEDAQFALRLAKDLRAGGAAVWMDRLDIKPGQRWDRAVEDALAKCPQLLVILSPAATESTNVMDEVSLALEEGKTVLPVIHCECKIPFRLRRLQYVDLTLDYKAGLGRLLETLGFAAPPSEMPEAAVDQELARSSDHDGGAEEVKRFSQTAPREHAAALPMPKKRVFGSVMAIIGIVAVLVALNQMGVFKRAEKKPTPAPYTPTAVTPTESATAPGQVPAETLPPEPIPNLAGLWVDEEYPGNRSQITQDGSSVHFTRWGVLPNGIRFESSGSGVITGHGVTSIYNARYQSGDTSTGECSGTVSLDAKRMELHCRDSLIGAFSTTAIRQ